MDEEHIFNSIMKVYFAQMDSAMKISKIISEHSGEEELSPDAFITGLVYRLMISMTDKEMKESMDIAETVLEEESSDEEDDEIEYDMVDEIILSRKLKKNNCNCDICAKARACLINYGNYETTDELAEKFKNSIDNTCTIHKIII
jgi:hypothetical protein